MNSFRGGSTSDQEDGDNPRKRKRPKFDASKLMAKMGYKEGQGLGKEGQGRVDIIDVKLRPMGAGVGAVKEKTVGQKAEERRQAGLRGEVLEESEDEEEKKRRRKPRASGTDSATSTPKRVQKTKYQSLPEIQRAAPGLHIPDAFTPILDMTGPGQRLLTSTSGLLTPTNAPESTELIEAKKLARQAQSDLSSFVEEWKNLEERKAWVQMELIQQQQQIDAQQRVADEMSSVAKKIQGLSQAVVHGQWDPVFETLTSVEDVTVTGSEELTSITVAAIHPFFRQAVEGWRPLEDPKLSGVAPNGFAPALSKLRHLLGMNETATVNGSAVAIRDLSISNGSRRAHSHKSTPYESLIFTVWLPKVRSAITNSWDVQDPAPVQELLTTWESLLPSFIRSQILDLVVQKLEEAVASWNPRKKRHAPLPHLWLFPWLQYLPAHHADPRSSSGLVSDVKRKFRQLIDSWDFRRGVIPGLQQWKMVLQPRGESDQWTPLLVNHVLHNLAIFLRLNFQVAPQDQEPYMPALRSVLAWQDILGPKMLGQLLVTEMFPMWHDVLHQWMTLESVNYDEVGEWLQFWMSIIPGELQGVKEEWDSGMELINRALELGADAKTSLPAPSRPENATENRDLPAAPAPKPALVVEELSFKERLENWCVDHELQLYPEKSTLEANGPVYRVTAAPISKGGALIYLRGERVFAQIKRGEWTGLGSEWEDVLFELAHR